MTQGNEVYSIYLEGEWTMQQAAELRQYLLGVLSEMAAAAPAPARAEIDVVGITDLDPCGCQLLAVFMEDLRRKNIDPVLCGVVPDIEERIALLGFQDQLSVSGPGREEA